QHPNGAVFLLSNKKLIQLTPSTNPISAGKRGSWLFHSHYRYFYAIVRDTIRVINTQFKNVANIFYESGNFWTESMDRFGKLHIYHNGIRQIIKGTDIIYKGNTADSILRFASLDNQEGMFYVRKGKMYVYKNPQTSQISVSSKEPLLISSIIRSK